jgi:hypothetical protein
VAQQARRLLTRPERIEIMQVDHRLLFNFSASYSTGGYKRLYEYAKWFNSNGGAWFIIHPRCIHLVAEFPNIRFFIANLSRFERLYNDCAYLETIEQEIGQPELYYSYGIPLYSRFGRVTWFHLSNVLPLGPKGVRLSLFLRLKAAFLGSKMRAGFIYADIISAESVSSLKMLGPGLSEKLFLSVNGSDSELEWLQRKDDPAKEEIATVVGTAPYKALGDSLRVFEMLKAANSGLKLVIIGEPKYIPAALSSRRDVVIRGLVDRSTVIECLQRTKFYISTTHVENSYNAAAEGIFFADESYISDIGPHRELLLGMPYDEVSIAGINRPVLRVRRAALTGANLKSWEMVIVAMIARFREALRVATP